MPKLYGSDEISLSSIDRSTREDAKEISEGRCLSLHRDKLNILSLQECSKKLERFAGAKLTAFNDKARNLELKTVGNALNKFKSNLKLVNDVRVCMCVEAISRSRHFCIDSNSSFTKERNAGGHACKGFESNTSLRSSFSFLISTGIVKMSLADKSKSTKDCK
jgi:hypothetical protein